MNYDKTIEFLYSLERFGIQFGLEKITYLLSLLNNPQDSFKSIHIAGTNGKGSTSSFIASILKESGFMTGLYTSPHLVDFRERIRLNGAMMPKKRLAEIVERLVPLIRKTNNKLGELTYFEVSTAIAFEYFKEEKVDFACIEVGMGGRLDATNVINPLVSVITSIGFDHMKELGNTLEKIAAEKAGIIKKDGILVCGVIEKGPLKNIKKICGKQNAGIYLTGRDFEGKFLSRDGLKTQKFSYKGINGNTRVFDISLLGEYQVHNAALALAAIEAGTNNYPSLREHINLNSVRLGLKNAEWPGRFEIIRNTPGKSGAPLIVLDGAHNPPGANELFKSLRKFFPGKRINFVLGILKDKDMEGIIKEIMPLAGKVIVTLPHCGRAPSLDELAGIAGKYNKPVEAVYPVSRAIERMKEKSGAGEVICVTGSLYTVGEARKALINKSQAASQ